MKMTATFEPVPVLSSKVVVFIGQFDMLVTFRLFIYSTVLTSPGPACYYY